MISTPGCEQPKQPEPQRVWDVSIGNLLRTGSSYIGYTVRLRLPANSYVVRRDGIEFPSVQAGNPPSAIFLSNSSPKDASKPVTIVGTVDRINRNVPPVGTVEYQTIVKDCTFTAD